MNEDDGAKIIATLNEAFALVLMGSRAMIMRETPAAPVEDRTRMLSIEAFKAYFHNRHFTVQYEGLAPDGKPIWRQYSKKFATYWLGHIDRRTFDGVEFFPDPANASGTPGYFNLWRGFGCAPNIGPQPARRLGYKTFHDHLLTNICSGDRELFTWVFAWLAHLVQRPRERIGTAIALRGKMGAGKTKVGEIIGSLFPSHYFLVDDPRYLVGNFNAHMASCLLLQVDEGFWAGDKAAEGRLKGLTTAPFQMIEAKGIDPIRLKNYVRLLFTSNEDWVIPAGMDERRFAVIDVSPHVAQNHGYFAEMDAEIANGGREALLADLLAFDLDAPGAPNLRVIPKTAALLEQKLRSLDLISAWWFERLNDGETLRGAGEWLVEAVLKDALYDDFVHFANKIGAKRNAEKSTVFIKLNKLAPGIRTTRPRGDGPRKWYSEVPALKACRAAFEEAVGQAIPWEE